MRTKVYADKAPRAAMVPAAGTIAPLFTTVAANREGQR